MSNLSISGPSVGSGVSGWNLRGLAVERESEGFFPRAAKYDAQNIGGIALEVDDLTTAEFSGLSVESDGLPGFGDFGRAFADRPKKKEGGDRKGPKKAICAILRSEDKQRSDEALVGKLVKVSIGLARQKTNINPAQEAKLENLLWSNAKGQFCSQNVASILSNVETVFRFSLLQNAMNGVPWDALLVPTAERIANVKAWKRAQAAEGKKDEFSQKDIPKIETQKIVEGETEDQKIVDENGGLSTGMKVGIAVVGTVIAGIAGWLAFGRKA